MLLSNILIYLLWSAFSILLLYYILVLFLWYYNAAFLFLFFFLKSSFCTVYYNNAQQLLQIICWRKKKQEWQWDIYIHVFWIICMFLNASFMLFWLPFNCMLNGYQREHQTVFPHFFICIRVTGFVMFAPVTYVMSFDASVWTHTNLAVQITKRGILKYVLNFNTMWASVCAENRWQR